VQKEVFGLNLGGVCVRVVTCFKRKQMPGFCSPVAEE